MILLGMVMAIALTMTLIVARYRPHGLLSSPLAFYGGWTDYVYPLLLTIVGVFMGGDSISSEFQSKTGYSMFGNPMSRATIYWGKLLGAIFASLLALLLFEAVEVVNGAFYFGPGFPVQVLISFAATVVAVLSVLGLAFSLSSILKSGSLSMLIEAILLLFAFNLVASAVEAFSATRPWYVLTYGMALVGSVLVPSLESVSNPTIAEGVLVMTVYFLIGSLVGLVAFQRSELK